MAGVAGSFVCGALAGRAETTEPVADSGIGSRPTGRWRHRGGAGSGAAVAITMEGASRLRLITTKTGTTAGWVRCLPVARSTAWAIARAAPARVVASRRRLVSWCERRRRMGWDGPISPASRFVALETASHWPAPTSEDAEGTSSVARASVSWPAKAGHPRLCGMQPRKAVGGRPSPAMTQRRVPRRYDAWPHGRGPPTRHG